MELDLPLEMAGYRLREYREDDTTRLCELADDREVWRWLTDLFPHPYDEAAARKWITEQMLLDPPRNLVIAGPDGLVGGIGIILSSVPNLAHDGEVGYWLGRPFWGRGLATVALRAFMAWAAPVHRLNRFTGRVFGGNTASTRVLLHCGFQREGILRAAVRKEGVVLDLEIYGLVVGS